MKKIIFGLLALCMVLGGLSSCASKRYDYDLSQYIDVGEYDPVRAVFADPALCTEEEIDNALFQVMLTYADFKQKEGGSAERYNKILLVYDIYYEGQALEDYHEEDYEIVIGSDSFGELDYALGEAFIGAAVGDVKSVEYTFPEDDYTLGFWAGVTVTAEGSLKAIYDHSVPTCTDEFVSSLEGYTFEKVEEFRAHLADEIRGQKEVNKASAVYRAFLSQVKVLEYPEKELEEYVEEYQADSKELAQQLEMDYEDYLKEYLETDLASFEAAALKDAKEQVKEEMACIQVSRLMGLVLSEEEYREGLEELFEADTSDEEFESAEEYEAHYTREEIENRLLWRKTFEEMVKRAVRIEE